MPNKNLKETKNDGTPANLTIYQYKKNAIVALERRVKNRLIFDKQRFTIHLISKEVLNMAYSAELYDEIIQFVKPMVDKTKQAAEEFTAA